MHFRMSAGDDMRTPWIEVVALSVQFHGDEVKRVHAKPLAIGLALNQERLVGKTVGALVSCGKPFKPKRYLVYRELLEVLGAAEISGVRSPASQESPKPSQ
jgi:hypothetical protein